MLHRDIKGHNIMVKEDGDTIILMDLGLAVVVHSSGACTRAGTANYSSQEKFFGQPYGPADDMWGLGCVLVELANRAPLTGPLFQVHTCFLFSIHFCVAALFLIFCLV
jgi:serine/threonine protein kinase